MTGYPAPGLASYKGMSPAQVRRLIRGAGRVSRRDYKQRQCWSFVAEVFSVGSTVANNLCVHAGIDPDSTIKECLQ